MSAESRTCGFNSWLLTRGSSRRLSAFSFSPRTTRHSRLATAIIPAMTLLEITYELHSPPSNEQLRRLGEFANTYGLRRLRVDEQHNRLTFEYDASRLRETQVLHALAQS